MLKEKIAFIICVNDEQSYEECLFYLNRLEVPQGMEVEVFAIQEAESIYQAYNYAMQQSDAKYKIYMHQDVFLIHKNILCDIVDMFRSNDKIGMIGLIGGTKVPENKRFYRTWDTGNVLGCNDKKAFWNELDKNATKVWAIDGMFMATQYDIPWREELDGWDFYDFSQSIEFQKAGYEIWVPEQPKPWSIHDCGYLSLQAYDERQKKFLEIYEDEFPSYNEDDVVYSEEYRNRFSLMMELKEEMKRLLFLGKEQEVKDTLEKIWDERFVDTEFVILKNILEILEMEKRCETKHFLSRAANFEDALKQYRQIKYALWRKRFAKDESDSGIMEKISPYALDVIKNRCMWIEDLEQEKDGWVSIILPTYNRADIILPSIESVLNQTYDKFELIIVDDGSVDNTQEVIAKIKDKRIRYLKQPENRGQAVARNIGIKCARYNLIAFQDSDDLWNPKKLELQVKALLSANTKTGMIYHKIQYRLANNEKIIVPNPQRDGDKKSGNIYKELLWSNLIGIPTLLVKKNCLEAVGGFDETLRSLEDYDLVLRIAKYYEAIFLDEVLLDAGLTEGSVSANSAQHVLASCMIVQKYKEDYISTGTLQHRIEKILQDAKQIGIQERIVPLLEKIMVSA